MSVVDMTRRAGRVLLNAARSERVEIQMSLVEQAYVSELGRPIDPVGAASWRHRIRARGATGVEAVAELRRSPEYLLGRTGFYDRLHQARAEWVRGLQSFDTILDIGGSSPTYPDGALLELGYPHLPSQIHILDRPEDEQFHGHPAYSQTEDRHHDWGTVAFHHGSAEDAASIERLTDLRFDCVFMGQTFEHIAVDRLPDLLTYIRHHLAPGGHLVLDTPNRDLTKLVVGDGFLTHDHTHEYRPDEAAELLESQGFAVERRWGILPMPLSAASGRFEPAETESGAALTSDPTECFVFALDCTVRA